MREVVTIEDVDGIEDPYEQAFASFMREQFPWIVVLSQVLIQVKVGYVTRETRPDFLLRNPSEQELYIEICGGKMTSRKRRQHRTAIDAGVGERHITFLGREVQTLVDATPEMAQLTFTHLLYQRLNPALFQLRPS